MDEEPDDEVTAEEQQKLDEVKQAKKLPEETYFNTAENPPTIQDKVKRKTKKILWNQ